MSSNSALTNDLRGLPEVGDVLEQDGLGLGSGVAHRTERPHIVPAGIAVLREGGSESS